ncbi:hypothetical protein JW835_13560 [bacterium]|nr:hypothetical protein [bacterium]
MKRLIFLYWIIMSVSVTAGQWHENSYRLSHNVSQGPAGNGIINLLIRDDVLYVGGDEGMAMTEDLGQTWFRSTHENGIGKGGVSALDVRDDIIWIATGFDTLIDQEYLPAGGGVGYSEDRGESWYWFKQPKDLKIEESYKPTTTHVQNITYDLAVTEDAVWIASFGGGLRKFISDENRWQVVTVDGYPFDALGNLSHRAFSVIYDGEALWAGTAGGVHKSYDGGLNWVTFSHQNQDQPISGNFIVAMAKQKTATRELIWAATWPTTTESGDETEFKAVSKSEDGGLTWTTILKNESAHNFAFRDSIAYIATDNGVFMSPDYGKTWAIYPIIYDAKINRTLYDNEINCVAAGPSESLWIGTSDGLGMTLDNGLTWSIFQAHVIPGEAGEPKTYACPNPFASLPHGESSDDLRCRFVYHANHVTKVKVSIYDFGLNLVKTLNYDVASPGLQAEPAWNGTNDLGDRVSNGVYFYCVKVTGEGEYWGKVMLVN